MTDELFNIIAGKSDIYSFSMFYNQNKKPNGSCQNVI